MKDLAPLEEIMKDVDDLGQEHEIQSPNGGQPNLAREPSRTSNRVRPNINYTNLAQGTGEASAQMDYGEP